MSTVKRAYLYRFYPTDEQKNMLARTFGCVRYTEQVTEENQWHSVRWAIQPDHVHLFIHANPYTLPTDIPRLIKGRSSHELREEFPPLMRMPSLWTRSTFNSTAGHVSKEVIDAYIERQSRS